MKHLLFTVLALLSIAAFADDACQIHLDGSYTAVGNSGFLSYVLKFNPDQTVELTQKLADGTLDCHGVYKLDGPKQTLTAVYNCPADEVVTHDISFGDLCNADLDQGAKVDLKIKSSLGSEAVVKVDFQKIPRND